VGEGTRQIRQELEETRLRVGEEVEALSYKTDVGSRLEDYVEEKKEAMTSKVGDAKESVAAAVGRAVPSRDTVERGARRAESTARSNPLGLAVGAAAAGFLAGLLVPSTRVEDEHLGEAASRVRETASEAGQEALERGRDVAESALQTVREEGTRQGRELAADLKERVQREPEGERTFQ